MSSPDRHCFQDTGHLLICNELTKLCEYYNIIIKSPTALIHILLKYKLYQHCVPHPVYEEKRKKKRSQLYKENNK
jgi:hypothetical protein